MKLEKYHKMVGTLEGFEIKDRLIDLKFIIRKNIEIPHEAFPIKTLEELKGERISIFRLDDHYYIKLF